MTDTASHEARFTPAANDAVDELVVDFRRAMMRRASANARQAGRDTEITVTDVVRAHESSTRAELDEVVSRRTELLALAVLLTAIAVSMTILLLAASDEKSSRMDFLSQSAVALAAVQFGAVLGGFATAAFSRRAFVKESGSWEDLEERQEADLIVDWANFELEVKAILGEIIGETTVAHLRLAEVLEELTKHGLVDEEDVKTLRRVLQNRNLAVHYGEVDAGAASQSLNDLRRIRRKLRPRKSRFSL